MHSPAKLASVIQFYFYIDWCVGEKSHLFLLRQIISNPSWRMTLFASEASSETFTRMIRILEYSKNWQFYYFWQAHKLLLIKLNSQPVWRIVNYPRRGEGKRISRRGNYLRFLVGECLNQDNSFCCEPDRLSGSRLWQGNRLWPSIRL